MIKKKEDERNMKTTLYHASELDSPLIKAHIHEVIASGGLVVFPTETVYGIGANALDSVAVKRIYHAKGRPSDNPLILHLDHVERLKEHVKTIPEIAYPLMKAFWPGPLTMIFEKKDHIPMDVTGGLNTVAIRIPSHPVALKVIEIASVPICAPSANLSGKPSSTEFKHVLEDFMDKVDIIIDGGQTDLGLESTVLDLTTSVPMILRPGMVTQEMIEKVIHIPIIDASEVALKETPKSPGMKYKHYAPMGEVTLLRGTVEAIEGYLNRIKKEQIESRSSAILAPKEFDKRLIGYYQFELGSVFYPDAIAKQLYSMLRLMDELSIQTIFIVLIKEHPLNKAIMNRLLKAANHQIVDL